MRLDVYLAQNHLTPSREQAKRLIALGCVTVNGTADVKASLEISENDTVNVTAGEKYVSRGGLKLEKAADCFKIAFDGLVCADIGASAGGFTDLMLQRGAAFVYAVDVGHGQLDEKISADCRVKSMEGVNVRDISENTFDRQIDMITVDISFISLKYALPKISLVLKKGGGAVMLIKPQFECGRQAVGKKGVVRSPREHIRAIEGIISECGKYSLGIRGLDFSPVTGGSGNIEYLLYAQKDGEQFPYDIDNTVRRAFDALGGGRKK